MTLCKRYTNIYQKGKAETECRLPCGLRRRPKFSQFVESGVRILLRTWVFVSFVSYVLCRYGLCDVLIT